MSHFQNEGHQRDLFILKYFYKFLLYQDMLFWGLHKTFNCPCSKHSILIKQFQNSQETQVLYEPSQNSKFSCNAFRISVAAQIPISHLALFSLFSRNCALKCIPLLQCPMSEYEIPKYILVANPFDLSGLFLLLFLLKVLKFVFHVYSFHFSSLIIH